MGKPLGGVPIRLVRSDEAAAPASPHIQVIHPGEVLVVHEGQWVRHRDAYDCPSESFRVEALPHDPLDDLDALYLDTVLGGSHD